MRRALAIVAAVLMVAAAFEVRARNNAEEDASRARTSTIEGSIVCATEVQRFCDQLRRDHPGLEVRSEEVGVTTAALSGVGFNPQSAKIDAWIVAKSYPAIVAESRSRAGLDPALEAPSKVLGRSPAVIVGFKDRLAALAKHCGVTAEQVDWKCIGAASGTTWSDVGASFGGTVKAGAPPPERTAAGLAVLSQAAGEQIGRVDFARNDFDDPGFALWFSQLKRSTPQIPGGGTPLDLMLAQGVSVYQVVGALEADAGPALDTARNKDKLSVLYPANETTIDLVVVAARGSEKGGRVKQLLESGETAGWLAKSGWRVDGQETIAGVSSKSLGAGDGLPAPGVLVALSEDWKAS